MIVDIGPDDPKIYKLSLYIYKDQNFMRLSIKDDFIMLYNEMDEGMQIKEPRLFEILHEYFDKNY